MLGCVGTLISLSGGMGVGIDWSGFDRTVGVIFENVNFCILGMERLVVWRGNFLVAFLIGGVVSLYGGEVVEG